MTIKEIVLKIKNRPGELARIFGHLHEKDVTVSAFWVGPEAKDATLRFIANDPASALSVLTGLDLQATTSDAIAAKIPDHPGGMNTILRLLGSVDVDIRHAYSCLDTQNPVLILDVDKSEAAIGVLKDNWITLYDEKL